MGSAGNGSPLTNLTLVSCSKCNQYNVCYSNVQKNAYSKTVLIVLTFRAQNSTIDFGHIMSVRMFLVVLSIFFFQFY